MLLKKTTNVAENGQPRSEIGQVDFPGLQERLHEIDSQRGRHHADLRQIRRTMAPNEISSGFHSFPFVI